MKKVLIGLGIIIVLVLYFHFLGGDIRDIFKKKLTPEEKQAQVERVNQTILEGIMKSEQDAVVNVQL